MVLRHTFLIAGLLAATSLVSCLPKQKGISAPTPMSVTVAAAVEYPDRPDISGVPDDLTASIEAALAGRNLQPTQLEPGAYTEVFGNKRNTLHRLDWLSEQGGDLVVLVETHPRYFSLLSGRYRWTVDATLSICPGGNLDETVTTDVSFPIFMEFHHEREEEVLAAAAPVLERHLGHLLDEVLGGL